MRNKLLKKKYGGGFTLVELIVSVSLFATIMVISMGTIVTVFDANKKSQTMRTVMDNLNLTVETISRTIRFGSNYHCDITKGPPSYPALTSPLDCASGASSMQVRGSDGRVYIYRQIGNRIARSINGSANYFLTSSDVTITSLKFRVFGSPSYSTGGDIFQPQVIITVSGYAGTKANSKSTFSLQTTVSQRIIDSQ